MSFGTDFGTTAPGPLSVNILLDCLMERCERNAEVQVLRLQHCYSISSEDVERLKEIVVNIIWDGFEQELEADASDLEEDYDDDGYNDG